MEIKEKKAFDYFFLIITTIALVMSGSRNSVGIFAILLVIKWIIGIFRREDITKEEIRHSILRIIAIAIFIVAVILIFGHQIQEVLLTNRIFTTFLSGNIAMPRKNVVLYNPVKGKEFTKHLISKDPSMRWKPLIGMTNDEVRKCLETSKVYVDFGNHPGKDRFPREAAMCGCCVITGKRGAAGFYKDIPIPSKYKFDDKKKEYDAIIEKIKYCFDNFSDAQADFEEYRETIKNEPLSFKSDVKKIFVD